MSYATEKPIAGIDTKIRISKNALVDLSDFGPEDVDLFSISRSLNNLKRFCGHYAYSPPLTVAQHTYLTMWIADKLYPNELGPRLMCLLHDMPEAYYGDLSSPLKRFLGDLYREKIKEIDRTVYQTLWNHVMYGNETVHHTNYSDFEVECKRCDHMSLRIEQNMLFGTTPPEDYVQEFMQKYDTKAMFNKVLNYENVDLKYIYGVYKAPKFFPQD